MTGTCPPAHPHACLSALRNVRMPALWPASLPVCLPVCLPYSQPGYEISLLGCIPFLVHSMRAYHEVPPLQRHKAHCNECAEAGGEEEEEEHLGLEGGQGRHAWRKP